MKMKRLNFKSFSQKQWLSAGAVIALTFIHLTVIAQDAAAGINEANDQVRSFFEPGTNLMYAVGAIVGLIGAVKVYQKWNAGDQDTGKFAAAWFGGCVFLVIFVTVIKAFFGVLKSNKHFLCRKY